MPPRVVLQIKKRKVPCKLWFKPNLIAYITWYWSTCVWGVGRHAKIKYCWHVSPHLNGNWDRGLLWVFLCPPPPLLKLSSGKSVLVHNNFVFYILKSKLLLCLITRCLERLPTYIILHWSKKMSNSEMALLTEKRLKEMEAEMNRFVVNLKSRSIECIGRKLTTLAIHCV